MNIPIEKLQPFPEDSSQDKAGLTFFDWFLPPPALPLLVLLMIILPMALLAAQSLSIPLVEFLGSLVLSGSEGFTASLPITFFIKLGAFIVLAFFGLVQLVLRINAFYYSVWARGFPRPHPLHVDYQPDSQQSMMALLNWKLYRFGNIVAPPVVLASVTFGLGLLALYMFNVSSGLPFISLSIQFIVGLFLIMLFSMFTVFAFINSIWTFFTTVFGDIIAITEPDLPAKAVFERCGRIVFSSPMIYIFYLAYVVFLVGVLAEIVMLFMNYNIQDLIAFKMNFPLLFGVELVTLAFYLTLNYLRFYTYHYALSNYYNKLPQSLKDRYSAPVSRFV